MVISVASIYNKFDCREMQQLIHRKIIFTIAIHYVVRSCVHYYHQVNELRTSSSPPQVFSIMSSNVKRENIIDQEQVTLVYTFHRKPTESCQSSLHVLSIGLILCPLRYGAWISGEYRFCLCCMCTIYIYQFI